MEKIKEIIERSAGIFNVIGGSVTLLVGLCIGIFMLLYGKKKLKKKYINV